MIVKVEKVYRCEFCSGSKRKKSFRRHIIARHETICFSNPNRTPMPGELTRLWQCGEWTYDYETGAADFVEHKDMPPWWPGKPGMIYTGSKWVAVDGYKESDGLGDEVWPTDEDGNTALPNVKPWVRRLSVLDIARGDMPPDVWTLVWSYRPIESWQP